jgi:hypothetical protein
MLNLGIEQPLHVIVRGTVTIRFESAQHFAMSFLVKLFVGLSCRSLMSQSIAILDDHGQRLALLAYVLTTLGSHWSYIIKQLEKVQQQYRFLITFNMKLNNALTV